MISSNNNDTYETLYNAWKEELLSNTLTSLNLNFIKIFLQQIDDLTSEQNNNFVNDIFVKRIEFLIHDLIKLRKIKILNSVLNNVQITSSYLSKQELLYYDYVKNSENILQDKPLEFSGQVKELISLNSNIEEQNLETKKVESTSESIHLHEGLTDSQDEVTVVFLQDLEEFLYLNERKFGPFKKHDIARIPTEIFSKVLFPKKIVQKKD